ncbi:MAG: MFS transporter [Thermovirgaceae bacterium]
MKLFQSGEKASSGPKMIEGKGARDYLLLWGLAFCHYSAVLSFFAFPLQVVRWGYSTMVVAFLAFAMDGTLVAVRPAVKWLIDRFMGKNALVLSSTLLVVTVLMLFAAGDSLLLLLLAKAMQGVSLSIFLVANLVYLHVVLPPSMTRRGMLWLGTTAMLPQLFMISYAEWAIMSGRLWAYYGMLLVLAAAACLLSALLTPRSAKPGERVTISFLLKERPFRKLALLTFSQAFIICMTNNFIALLLGERGVPVSAFFVPFAIGTLLLRGPLSALVDARNPHKVLVAGFTVTALSTAGLALSWTWAMTASFAFLLGIGFAPLQSTVIALAVEAYPQDRTAVITGIMTAEDTAWATGPLVGGVLGSAAVTLIYWGSSLAGAAAAIFGKTMVGGKHETKKEESPEEDPS